MGAPEVEKVTRERKAAVDKRIDTASICMTPLEKAALKTHVMRALL